MRIKKSISMKRMIYGLTALVGLSVYVLAQDYALRLTATSDNVSGVGEPIKINLLKWSTDAERDQFVAAWMLTGPAARGGAGRGGGGRGGAGAGGAGGGARGGAAARGAAAPAAGAADTPAADATAANAPAAAGRGGGRGGNRGGAAAAAATDAAVLDLPADDAATAAAVAAARGGRGGNRGGGAAAAAPLTPASSLFTALQNAPALGYLWTSEVTGYSIRYAFHVPQALGGERIILAMDRRLGSSNALWKPVGTAAPTNYEFTLVELRLNAKGEGEGKASLTGNVTVNDELKSLVLEGYDTLPVVLKAVKKK